MLTADGREDEKPLNSVKCKKIEINEEEDEQPEVEAVTDRLVGSVSFTSSPRCLCNYTLSD